MFLQGKWLLLPKQARVFVKRSGCKVLLLSHDLLVCSFMNAVFMCCLPSASDLDMCDLHGQQKGGEVSDLGRQASRFLSPEAQKV